MAKTKVEVAKVSIEIIGTAIPSSSLTPAVEGFPEKSMERWKWSYSWESLPFATDREDAALREC